MSKAATSRHIAELEGRLGVRLLNRTTRKLSLTGEGAVFYARCKELLAGVESAESEISATAGEARGVLRVNAPVSFGIRHLAEVWAAFHACHPQVTFDITLSDRVVDIVEESVDIAIRISRLESSSLVSRRLSSTKMVLCASPAYIARHGAPAHPQDIAKHAVLAYTYWTDKDEWEFTGPEGRVVVHTEPVLRTNNGDTCRAGALAAQGIILQPTFMICDDLESGELIELCPDYRCPELGIYAVYGSRRHLTPKVRLLIDFLAERFAGRPW
jgi:DNA-binding transcriptional LysR family regulator